MLERFANWTIRIEPTWAGFVVFATGVFSVGFVAVALFVFVAQTIGAWVFLIFLAFIARAFYLALFKQEGRK